jgi:hypothetical protein
MFTNGNRITTQIAQAKAKAKRMADKKTPGPSAGELDARGPKPRPGERGMSPALGITNIYKAM